MVFKVQKLFFSLLLFAILLAVGTWTISSWSAASMNGESLELELNESFNKKLSDLDSLDSSNSFLGLISSWSFKVVFLSNKSRACCSVETSLQKMFNSLNFRGPPSL
jgi:hypothetical protein